VWRKGLHRSAGLSGMGGVEQGIVVADGWGSWAGCPLNVEGTEGGSGGEYVCHCLWWVLGVCGGVLRGCW